MFVLQHMHSGLNVQPQATWTSPKLQPLQPLYKKNTDVRTLMTE
jgi:hypothetical protein